MDAKTVFTKTAKGVTQIHQKTQSLSRQLTKILKSIDGKSNLTALAEKVDLDVAAIEKDLAQLQKDGFIKIFEIRQIEPISEFGGEEDDFDFTAPAVKPPSIHDPVVGFGPSKYRGGVSDQVESAAPAAKVDEATQIANQLAARRKKEEDDRIAAEALAAARLAAHQAQAAARARAEREAQIRARLEVEAQARKDAEARAIEEAKRAEAAAAKSRTELEARIAEEAKNRADMAASSTRQTEQQQAQGAAAQRALAEARAKAETEAKAFAAARAKIEIETKALAVARAEAEAASVRQQEELALAQRELRTQLKAEIEAKVRAELDVLLKSDIDDDARAEVEDAIRAEARDDARRQLEEQLANERTSLARIDSEARQAAEKDAARMLAEQETRLRAEMDARLKEMAAEKAEVEQAARRMVDAQHEAAAKAAAEFAARLKAEEEARRVVEEEAAAQRQRDEAERQRLEAIVRDEAVARARADAEARAAVEAEKRAAEEVAARKIAETQMNDKLMQEKQARIEAQANALLEADKRAKAQRESDVELESARRAREEAEDKARRESKAREIATQAVAQQVAEKKIMLEQAEQRIALEREARERAEAKAYADERAEEAHRQAQVARLKELTEQAERNNDESESVVTNNRRRGKQESHVVRSIVIGVVVLLAGSMLALHLVPLNAVNAKMEKALSEWLHDDVTLQGLRVALFPKPHVKIDQLALGKGLDAKAGSGKIYMDIGAIFGDKFVIESIVLTDITIAAEALPRAVKWASAENRGSTIEIGKMDLRNIKLEVKGVTVEVFDGEVAFNRKGEITRAHAKTRDGKWTLDVVPDKTNPVVEGTPVPWAIDFSARNWMPPIGAQVLLSSLSAKGLWSGDDIVFTGVEAKLLEGSGKGDVKINLQNGIVVKSEFTLERFKVDELVSVFSRDISLTGRAQANLAVSASSSNIGALLDTPNIAGNFLIRDGTLSNFDLVQAMRTPGSVGGQTKFSEFSGKVRISDNVVRYEAMKLAGGVLTAGGNVNVGFGKGTLSGSVNAEIRSTVAQDRANFSIGGTVARPSLKRG